MSDLLFTARCGAMKCLCTVAFVTLSGISGIAMSSSAPIQDAEIKSPAATKIPDDLRVIYDWEEGSLPPPHHYSYRIIVLANGTGQVEFVPGYSFQDTPKWIEPFTVSLADMEKLYAKMDSSKVFSKLWRKRESRAVGGSLSLIDWVANGKSGRIPSTLEQDDQAAYAAIVVYIRSLVPHGLWADLQARRSEFMKNEQ